MLVSGEGPCFNDPGGHDCRRPIVASDCCSGTGLASSVVAAAWFHRVKRVFLCHYLEDHPRTCKWLINNHGDNGDCKSPK